MLQDYRPAGKKQKIRPIWRKPIKVALGTEYKAMTL
jgi:hypothetical protein